MMKQPSDPVPSTPQKKHHAEENHSIKKTIYSSNEKVENPLPSRTWCGHGFMRLLWRSCVVVGRGFDLIMQTWHDHFKFVQTAEFLKTCTDFKVAAAVLSVQGQNINPNVDLDPDCKSLLMGFDEQSLKKCWTILHRHAVELQRY